MLILLPTLINGYASGFGGVSQAGGVVSSLGLIQDISCLTKVSSKHAQKISEPVALCCM